MKKTSIERHAKSIAASWRKGWESVIETGLGLIRAKEEHEHGDFLRLFKGHENVIECPLPFSKSTAESLMRIASNTVLSNSQHAGNLPPSWTTLYELCRLDDEQIVAGIKAGEIHAEMSRADAAALRDDSVLHPERELCVLAWEALSSAYAKYADKLGKDDRLFVLERLESLVRLIKQEALPDASRRQRGGSSKAAKAAG